jgi:hypothetical protein
MVNMRQIGRYMSPLLFPVCKQRTRHIVYHNYMSVFTNTHLINSWNLSGSMCIIMAVKLECFISCSTIVLIYSALASNSAIVRKKKVLTEC